jgi:hypothetical protein
MQELRERTEQAAARALEHRLTSGEVLTYQQDGWVVREWPGGRVERLCRSEDFLAGDFPVAAPPSSHS